MPVKARTLMPVLVVLFFGLSAVAASALADYLLAGALGIVAIATAVAPKWIAYQFRQGMWGAPRTWMRATSLGLSTPSLQTPGDSYVDYQPTDEHWVNAYHGMTFVIVLCGLRWHNWRALLAVTVILLIGRIICIRSRSRARLSNCATR